MPSHRLVVCGLLAVAIWIGAPQGSAQAQDDSAQVSFLARMMIDVTMQQLTLEDGFLIRLPVGARTSGHAASSSSHYASLLPGYSTGLVDLLGRGLDLSSQTQDDGQIRLQLKPNFGRRGGLLRCTFRF